MTPDRTDELATTIAATAETARGERRHIAGWTGTVTRLRIADDGAMVHMDADLPDELRRAGVRDVVLYPEEVE